MRGVRHPAALFTDGKTIVLVLAGVATLIIGYCSNWTRPGG